MANEITINASLEFEDDFQTLSDEIVDRIVSPSVKKPFKTRQTIGTSEEAINLGEISSLGYAMFRNLDPTNYVELRVSSGGAKFARLDPDTDSNGKGGVALLRLGSGAQVPYAIADTGPCDISVTIFSA